MAEEVETEEFGRISVVALAAKFGYSHQVLTAWIRGYGIDQAMSRLKLYDRKGAPGRCLWCGEKTKGTQGFCSFLHRKLFLIDKHARGELPPHMLETCVCKCGCGRSYEVISGYNPRRYFSEGCRRVAKKRETPSSRCTSSSFPVKTWAPTYDRPAPCKTCAKYLNCCTFMADNGYDRGWPCEVAGSWDAYVKEVPEERPKGARAINTTLLASVFCAVN